MNNLKAKLVELVAQAEANKVHRMAEMQVQSSYVIKVLELLGWKDSDWQQGASQRVGTGNFPDIVLHDKSKDNMLVVECKDAKKLDKLDGYYGSGKNKKSFEEQLYGYCRAEGVYWGVLTNFVEWRLYNVVHKDIYGKRYAFHSLLWPKADRRFYTDLLSDEGLAFLKLISREYVCHNKGKIDPNPLYYPKEVILADTKAKFFDKLKGWRETLRNHINHKYKDKYNTDEIDLYTQRILDRLIFIDVCHDKGIINEDNLRAVLETRDNAYKELKNVFKQMEQKFNTELFTHQPIDDFALDNDVISPIVRQVTDFDFKDISVHIIGEVYENYLGELLHKARKSDDLNVQVKTNRKSQGIYYTPDYIVDYIVKNTVGELLTKAKATEDIKKIKVLDPACGSGSFLICAFDYFYKAYELAKNKGQTAAMRDFDITKAILQNNLFGVDLDERAVEITKLNLMLKALEGLNWKDLPGDKLLPNLSLNIRQGNSLISGQMFEKKHEGELFPWYDAEPEIPKLIKLRHDFHKAKDEKYKENLLENIKVFESGLNRDLNENLKGYFKDVKNIKPLNYQVAFPDVFKQGGFDAVIGNPPYGANFDKSEKDYFTKSYANQNYQLDSYLLFFEKSVSHFIKEHGYFGMIIPNPWMTNLLQQKLRNFIVNCTKIKGIVHFTEKVFPQATVDTEIIVLSKEKTINPKIIVSLVQKNDAIKVFDVSNITTINHDQHEWVKQNGQPINIFLSKKQKTLAEKISNAGKTLGHYTMVNVGIKPYQVGKGKPKQTKETVDKRVFDSDQQIDASYRQYLRGCDIQRYCIEPTKKRYLKYGLWLAEPRPAANFEAPEKIFMRQTGDSLIAAYDSNQFICMNNMHVIVPQNKNISMLYVLGLLNSKLMNWYYQSLNPEQGEALAEVKKTNVENLPIVMPKDVGIVIKITNLVKEMLKLNKTPELRQRNKHDIAAIDHKINELVYGLYGLNEAEKKVVEGLGCLT